MFVTGRVSMPEKIIVSVHDVKGAARRQIAHTCSNSIGVGTSYSTQQEFDFEFNAFLKDETSLEYSIV